MYIPWVPKFLRRFPPSEAVKRSRFQTLQVDHLVKILNFAVLPRCCRTPPTRWQWTGGSTDDHRENHEDSWSWNRAEIYQPRSFDPWKYIHVLTHVTCLISALLGLIQPPHAWRFYCTISLPTAIIGIVFQMKFGPSIILLKRYSTHPCPSLFWMRLSMKVNQLCK